MMVTLSSYRVAWWQRGSTPLLPTSVRIFVNTIHFIKVFAQAWAVAGEYGGYRCSAGFHVFPMLLRGSSPRLSTILNLEYMRKLTERTIIYPRYGDVAKIAKDCGCSTKSVSLALKGINDTDLTRLIRKRAIEVFGCKYWPPWNRKLKN